MKFIISLVAALSILFGTAPASIALAAPVAAANSTCSGSLTTWQHLGGAPYARNEAEAMKKMPAAIRAMAAASCLPQGAVEGVIKMIHDRPQGGEVDGTHKLVTLNNGMHLDFMESAKHPYVNVTVGLVSGPGRGLVVSVQAKVWAFTYDGVIYYVYMPLICFNWSLGHQPAPKQAAQPEQCAIIRTQFDARTDKVNHFGFFGPDAMKGSCWHWHYEGESAQHSYQECPDTTCGYDAIAGQVNNMHLTFKGRTDLAPPTGVRWVEYSVSREFAESRFDMGLFCLERKDGQMSCGKMVRHDDYQSGVAAIYRSKADYPSSRSGRTLIWDFFANPQDCLKNWTH